MNSLPTSTRPTRVAVSGATGYLGSALIAGLSRHFPTRGIDVTSPPSNHGGESLAGDVSNLDDAMKLCEGCTDLVISHMAPNRAEIYAAPPIPFDVNVKGVANLFHAAVTYGLRRVILMSSIGAVGLAVKERAFLDRDLPLSATGLYGLSKVIQEYIGEYYHHQHGLEVAAMRLAHVCDDGSFTDKYGKMNYAPGWDWIDRRDIAEAVRLALTIPVLGYERFYVLGHPDSRLHADIKFTEDFLGWKAEHDFQSRSFNSVAEPSL